MPDAVIVAVARSPIGRIAEGQRDAFAWTRNSDGTKSNEVGIYRTSSPGRLRGNAGRRGQLNAELVADLRAALAAAQWPEQWVYAWGEEWRYP